MNMIMLVASCLMLTAALLIAAIQIKGKKSVTDPYLILSILTCFIALLMIYKQVCF